MRMVEQGGVRINGVRVTTGAGGEAWETVVLQVGSASFARVTLS